jgi:HopA1 effector protein family
MTMTSIRTFADKAEIVSATRFALGGESYEIDAVHTDAAAPGGLLAQLEKVLYSRLYTRSRPLTSVPIDSAQREFVGRLSAANVGRGTFEPGWTVKGREPDGSIAVEKDGLTVWALPTEFQAVDHSIEPGTTGMVRIGKEQRQLNPGLYFAFGDTLFGFEASAPLVRVYWHVSAAGAPPLVRAITLELNGLGVPFRFKTLSEPRLYSRADAAVVYMLKKDYARARPGLARAYHLVAPWLRSEVPLMTKAIGAGVGLAEDPGGAMVSFGQHRCAIVAESLWRSFEAGRTTPAGRVADMAQLFAEKGFDVERLYLQPDSADEYRSLERKPSARAKRA